MPMFWQKKDDKNGLPNLPPLKPVSPPPLEDDDEDDLSPPEKHSLPSFPDSPMAKGFSQSAIRDAVGFSGPENKSKSFKTIEMEDWEEKKEFPAISSPSPPSAIPAPVPLPPSERFTKKPEAKSDIFVKIDRFYSAKKALDVAKSKLGEIDELLKKIRETRIREDQEISAWEKEMGNIKVRIKEVTENIFEKIE